MIKKYYKIQLISSWFICDLLIIYWSLIHHLELDFSFSLWSDYWICCECILIYHDLDDSTFLTMSYICFSVYSWNRSQIAVDQCKTVFKIFFITGHHVTCRDVGSFFLFFKNFCEILVLININQSTVPHNIFDICDNRHELVVWPHRPSVNSCAGIWR